MQFQPKKEHTEYFLIHRLGKDFGDAEVLTSEIDGLILPALNKYISKEFKNTWRYNSNAMSSQGNHKLGLAKVTSAHFKCLLSMG